MGIPATGWWTDPRYMQQAAPVPMAPAAPAKGGNPFLEFLGSSGGQFIGNSLADYGMGLMAGKNWQQGLAMGAAQSAQMAPARAQEAERAAALAKEQQQSDATIKALQEMAARNAAVQPILEGVQLGAINPADGYWEAVKMSQPQPEEAYTLGPGEARFVGGQRVASMPANQDDPATSIEEYQFYANQELLANRQPLPYGEWRVGLAQAGSSAADPFRGKIDAAEGDMIANLAFVEGPAADKQAVQIGQLETLFGTFTSGGDADFKRILGNFGINGEGLSQIQAAEALINQLVPLQRPPGSGTMSDRDLALFRESLPRVLNQPGGNRLILEGMKAINGYVRAQSDIARQVAEGAISREEGRRMMKEIPNPLEGYQERVRRLTGQQAPVQHGPANPQTPYRSDGRTLLEQISGPAGRPNLRTTTTGVPWVLEP